MTSAPAKVRSTLRWAAVLGIAIGGFFDGVLLHQILQWHHLLSLVPGIGDLRAQVLWDGYFHALMYVLALAALVMLWRQRGDLSRYPARKVGGAIMLGFGAWHGLDAVLSHWVLGLHRIRLDSDHPLLWDLGWLAIFGIAPGLAGLRLLQGDGASGGTGRGGGTAATLLGAGALAAMLGGWSLRPPPGPSFTTIVFAPGVSAAEATGAVMATGGRLVWADPALAVMVVDLPGEARALDFYRRGALLVSGTGSPAGCAAWTGSPS
ncbi:DUF2243 domain-containing protein [Novosphingobium silvae]|jgi:uncharacterized membrane protein|uniref:DUF2243 domain-containing protein n=1 Tax=Novosphingobium silvae TaxID=2692619 RepID=UPI0019263A78